MSLTSLQNTSSVASPQPQLFEDLPVERVMPVAMRPPHICKHQIDLLRGSLDDLESYDALLIKRTTADANEILRGLVAEVSDRPVFHLRLEHRGLITVVLPPSAEDGKKVGFTPCFANMLRTLRECSALQQPMVLYISFYVGSLTYEAELSLAKLVTELREIRRDIKLVIATPAPRLASMRSLPNVEVMDADAFPWDFAAKARSVHAAKLLQEYHLDLPLDDTVEVFKNVATPLLENTLLYAAVLGKRRHQQDGTSPPRCGPQELREAARLLQGRTQETSAEAAADTSFVEPFLVRNIAQFKLDEHVAGVPMEVRRFVARVRHHDALRKVVPTANKTLLLKGPPGTGKTTIARALASETGYPLFAPKSSALVNKFIGASASNVYRLFAQAQAYGEKHHTNVIVFIDEIDAIANHRTSDGTGAGREYARVVNAFLESLQGVGLKGRDNLIIVGATNLPEMLDPAIVERFAFAAEVGLPHHQLLKDIIRLHLRGREVDPALSDADLDNLAHLAQGFSGRLVVNAIDQAGMLAFEAFQTGKPLLITAQLLVQAIAEQAKRRDSNGSEPPAGIYN